MRANPEQSCTELLTLNPVMVPKTAVYPSQTFGRMTLGHWCSSAISHQLCNETAHNLGRNPEFAMSKGASLIEDRFGLVE